MENIRQSTHGLGQALFGFGILIFMLVGLSGTLYKLLAPGGWLSQMFGHSISTGMAVLAGLGFIGLVAWFSQGRATTRSHFSDVFVYGFTIAGLVYAARFWTTGVF
jgi:hypothetical protein